MLQLRFVAYLYLGIGAVVEWCWCGVVRERHTCGGGKFLIAYIVLLAIDDWLEARVFHPCYICCSVRQIDGGGIVFECDVVVPLQTVIGIKVQHVVSSVANLHGGDDCFWQSLYLKVQCVIQFLQCG